MRDFCDMCQKEIESYAWKSRKVEVSEGEFRWINLCHQHFKMRPYELGYIKKQREKYAADLVQPWDSRGKPNPDFIRLYPDQAIQNFKEEELKGIPLPTGFAKRVKSKKQKTPKGGE